MLSTREVFEKLLTGETLAIEFISQSALNSFKGAIYVYRMRYNKSLEKLGAGGDIFGINVLTITKIIPEVPIDTIREVPIGAYNLFPATYKVMLAKKPERNPGFKILQ